MQEVPSDGSYAAVTTRAFIIRVTLAYGLGALIWIYLSDRLIASFGGSSEVMTFSTFKGVGFVAVTTALLVIVLRRLTVIARDEKAPPQAPRKVWPGIIALLVLTVPVLMVGALVYRSSANALLNERRDNLLTMTALEERILSQHGAQRIKAARMLATNTLLRAHVTSWLAYHDTDDLSALRHLLQQTTTALDFSSIELWDAAGRRLMWVGMPGKERDDVRAAIPQVAKSGAARFIPMAPDIARYGYLVPVTQEKAGTHETIALLYLDASASSFLYPFLAQAGSGIGSTELFLARKDSLGAWTSASPIRGQSAPPMRHKLPAGLAALAESAVAEPQSVVTTDQSGREILAVARPMTASTAILIAKIDTKEALAEARGLTLFAVVTTAAALAMALVFALFFAERQKLRTALREVEQARALAAAEERFELAVQGADEAVCDYDLRTETVYFSSRWKEMLGLPPEAEIDRATFEARLHPDDRARFTDRWNAMLSGNARPFAVEFRLKCGDGTYHDFSLRGHATTDASGAVVRLVGLSADVTERKQTERRLRLAATVFTGTNEGIVVTDSDGVITAINPAFAAITGYTEDEAIGRSMSLLKSGRHDRQFYRQMWQSILTAGTWRGELWNRRKNGEVYLQQIIISTVHNASGEAQSFVGAFHDITQAKRSQFELDHLTHYDALTDLPNRTLLFSLIEHAMTRPGECCALLFVDLDHFKTINDSLGLLVGDSVIQAAARRIQATIPPTATLGRYGADEFVILLEDTKGADDAAAVAVRIIAGLKEPFVSDTTQEIYVGGSIGISLHPQDATTAPLLLQHAHSALFQAKASGRGTYSFYTGAMTRTAQARIEMEADLRRALARGELQVHYQPIMDLMGSSLVGAEALVRWLSPNSGLIMPDRFIPLAEETGLIEPLGDFVMEEACRQLMEWDASGIVCPYVSVNLSPRQFNQPNLCRRVADILQSTGLPAERLELEITERILFEELAGAERKLAELAETGVKMAVDDFGTGYSSLAYLKRFPLNKLKIDKSFVRDLPQSTVDGEIVRAVIAVGRALNLEILAEGVETEAQMDFLRANGCRLGQGYLWSRPLPALRFRAFARAMSEGTDDHSQGSGGPL